ncbi:MAG: hypothetical protein LUP95_06100 [Euryarchaeota archaeon]|nr:hypothetical protein [Euryarchaeota archaeon]
MRMSVGGGECGYLCDRICSQRASLPPLCELDPQSLRAVIGADSTFILVKDLEAGQV